MGGRSIRPRIELALSGIGNTKLRPERGTELEGGVDADLFDARLSVELTTYRKVQVDALMPVQLPPSVHGGGTQLINLGNIRNTGLELTVGVTPVQSSLLTWRTSVTYSRNSNTLTKLGDDVLPNKLAGIVEGYPLYSRWARPILAFADQNGDQVIDGGEVQVGDSLVYVGLVQPAYTSALTTDAQLFGGAVSVSAGFSYIGGACRSTRRPAPIGCWRRSSAIRAPRCSSRRPSSRRRGWWTRPITA